MSHGNSKVGKARMSVPNFGVVSLKGTKRVSGKVYTTLLNAQLVDKDGIKTIQRAVDQMTGVTITATRGHYSSLAIDVEIDVHLVRDAEQYTRSTSCDLIAKIGSIAEKTTATSRPIVQSSQNPRRARR